MSVSVMVFPLTVTLAMDPSRPFQAPLFGSRARSRLHLTSLEDRGLPSANLRPLLRVRVTVLPSLETLKALARLGRTRLPSSVGSSRVEYRLVRIQISKLASLSTGSRNSESA